MFTKLQTSVNMNLSQLSENLQCAEMVIQFRQEKKTLLTKLNVAGHVSLLATKKKWGKVMAEDAVKIPNAGPGLLLNCLMKV